MSSKAAPASSPASHIAVITVWTGLIALAVAMGIGRFAFTPLLPLMQQDAGLTLTQGGWLATANYVGYLAGAVTCISAPPRPTRAVQWGLAAIAVSTFGMPLTDHFWFWFALRFVAGAASAFVLVGVSAWAMPILAHLGKSAWSGRVFSGVGAGICFTGLISLVAAVTAWGSRATWICLGVTAAIFTSALWSRLTSNPAQPSIMADVERAPLSRQAWIAALCYGVFGYGYIIPATFLPALAREAIANPSVFGWVWPVFGAAAALSTALAARLLPAHSPRRLWAHGQWVLAVGVIAPVLTVNLYVLMFSALCVGGTFMVITMAGIQEARRLGGMQGPRLIAAFTAAFALGQIVGPLTVTLFHGSLIWPSLLAALALAASSVTLAFSAGASGDSG
ncbi:MAG: MFS transporter [Afipia sp. 62-7]|nr:YbfB/YjiJ family MFS transporter [Afipia sp.]OJU20595.1 MAG: MFS transporter [Afipia sp. 62-7]